MVKIAREVFLLIFISTIVLLQIGCENPSDQEDIELNEHAVSSYEKMQLLSILDEQTRLIEDLRNAVEYGDKELATELYESIIRLDQSYQDEFEEYEDKLSPSDSGEISQKHYTIIKSIPSYSNLMK